MSRIKHRILAVTVLLLIAAATVVEARTSRQSRDKSVEKTFAVQGRQVSLESLAADISVVAVSGDEARLRVELEFWSSDEEWMRRVEEEFGVEMIETSSRVSLRLSEMPGSGKKGLLKQIFGSGETFYSLDIGLELPLGTALAIDNRYGDIQVSQVLGALEVVNSSGELTIDGVRGGAEIENSYGDVTVSDVEGELRLVVTSGAARVEGVTGDAKVSNRYGEVWVTRISGELDLETSSSEIEVEQIGESAIVVGSYADARVKNVQGALKLEVSSGNIELADIEGDAEVTSSYGSIEIDGIGGALTVRSSSGEVEVRDVGGRARIENSYGAVLLQRVRGSGEINNPSGGVTVDGVEGSLSVRSSYEAARVRNVGGDLSISASSAGISANDIAGRIEITTSYAGVEVEGAGGAVDIRNQSGRVVVSGLHSAALSAQHRVETSYGDVDFSWPSGAGGMSFAVESTYGSIQNDFPATRRKSGSRQNAEGRAGREGAASGATVSLTARSGNVILREE